MKYKAKLINKKKEDLTKEDLKSMIRRDNPSNCISVKQMMDYYGIDTIYDYIDFIRSKGLQRSFREVIALRNERDRKNEAEEKVSKPLESNLKPFELTAMRYYRGVTKDEMADKISLPRNFIDFMESESPVSLMTEDYYTKALNIKTLHINQLRKVLKGEMKEINEDRSIPNSVKREVSKRDNNKCSHCDNVDNLHYHHIIKFSQGGQNTVENLMLLCPSCHAKEHKGDVSYYMLKAMAKE